ncbi:CAP domain-containing protein [Segetibacter sp. 3557_3]|uniref:CAP domain-containing protein n=1 Tax=Segetibacter sp. 3557_3 TaxID=2547429 RepID=UPI00105904C2|nr:CAP domain-containing protein [Segetibacter sp. 3557_3]TDH25199.1 CAP domain-containing protein [Segetibacter sp. 3557_3]
MKSILFHVKPLLFGACLFVFTTCTFAQHFGTARIEVKPLPAFPSKQAVIEASYVSSPLFSSLSPDVKEWYYWTNYTRLRPRAMWDSVIEPILKIYPNLNTGYAKSLKQDLYQATNLPPLTPNSKLLDLAFGHARDLASNNARASHSSTNGATFDDRMTRAGILKCAGENISVGAMNTIMSLVFLLLDQGIPDVGHRKALLNPRYTEVGIGLARYKDGNVVVVQDFACPQTMK